MALRPKAALCVGLVLTVLLTVGYWRSTWDGAAGGPAGRPVRPRISATVMPASSVRCNRINLPRQFYNATTAPYNPAAARHPGTKEWVLLHTFDEVRPSGQARMLKNFLAFEVACLLHSLGEIFFSPLSSSQACCLRLPARRGV